jgi:GNAT superfamily N-acetyltransferase
MFILPDFMGQGIGTMLVEHLRQSLKNQRITHFRIFVDPHARGFYEKMGAKFIRDSHSSIPGRKIPVYEMLASTHQKTF